MNGELVRRALPRDREMLCLVCLDALGGRTGGLFRRAAAPGLAAGLAAARLAAARLAAARLPAA